MEGEQVWQRVDAEFGVDPAPAPGSAPEGVNDVHFKPVEPISFRFAMTIRF